MQGRKTKKKQKKSINLTEGKWYGRDGFNITSMNGPREAINVINHYEEIMKITNKKMIGYVAIQRQMFKEVYGPEDFIENVY